MPPLKANSLSSKIENALQWAISIANDDSHGYSDRWGERDGPNYDCSSLVYYALSNAGIYIPGSAFSTRTMRAVLVQCGFQWIPWDEISGEWGLLRGDILLDESAHTMFYLGNSSAVAATYYNNENPSREIEVQGYWNGADGVWWDGVLRYTKEDIVIPSKPSLSISTGSTTSKTTFSWNACSNADWYDARVYKSDDTNLISTFNINGLDYSIDLPQGDYYATVHSVNSNGTYTGSDAVSFSVGLGICEPKAVTSYNGHVYALYENMTYYDQAKSLAEKMGGHLATITSKGENEAVTSLMGNASQNGYWLGGTRVNESSWKWSTGESFSYSNWESGEPNNSDGVENYAEIYKSGKWNDARSMTRWYKGFILEIDSLDISEIKEYGDHLYYRFDKGVNWTEANEYCKMLGGNLAVITSEEENEFVHDLVKDAPKNLYWIGLYDPDKTKTFKWIDGSEYNYDGWSENQPDCAGNAEFYGEIYKSSGKWNDDQNYTGGAEGFICEIDKKVKEIKIKNEPDKKEYYLGDTIDLAGMTLDVTYDIGESNTISSGFTANADMNVLGTQRVTVTYKGKSAEFEINIKCPKPEISLISKTDNSVELSWREIPIASEYAVIINGSEKTRTSDISCEINGLNASTNYDIQVVAYEGKSKLETSDAVSVETARRITFSGTGTSDDPYCIGNAEDLICMAEMINDKLTNGHFKNCYYRQTSDINLSGTAFEPIGNNTVFAGNYDGDHHIISGMNVNSSAGYAGLFGKVGEPDNPIKLSEISNLVVYGNVDSSDSYAGGIAGMISYNTNIYQCGFYGDITSTEDTGGIAGRIEKGGVISSCYHNGTVNGSTAGGIVGQIIKSTDAGYDSFIVSSYHHNGKANGSTTGGICGYIDYVENSQGIISLYNNFYEKGSATYGIGNGESSDARAVNHTVISAIGETLGAPFKDHEDTSRNNGCPVFVWELPMYKFSGAGTPDNPYLISSKEELVQLSEYLNDSVYSTIFNKASYQQTTDIDLKGVSWKPMSGNRTAGFNGSYDGACHTIDNLTVSNDRFGGLFGYVSVGTVKNLVINNGSITAKSNAGGITAQLGNKL
ncbi:MAG TPA: lectin-like protein [Ruminococcus flavefaciens]|nr:lectin-like protein [Ruminococcus flavefaciens]